MIFAGARPDGFLCETGQTIKAKNRPIIIITNNEKELPDAFCDDVFFTIFNSQIWKP